MISMESTKLPSNPTAATPGVSATSTPSPLPPTTITTPQLAPPGTGPTTADLPADIKGSIKSNTTRVVGEDIARDKVKH